MKEKVKNIIITLIMLVLITIVGKLIYDIIINGIAEVLIDMMYLTFLMLLCIPTIIYIGYE